MGGMGSGGYMRWGKSTVDSQHGVDIRYFKKQGLLKTGSSGTLTWSCGGEKTGYINYRIEVTGIKLIYKVRTTGTTEWEHIEQLIYFDYTPCNYGGKRIWLLCPHCSRRVSCIYGAGTYFLCRHCYDLNHQSQHEDYFDRQLTKAQGIRKKLGGSRSLAEPFPEKPKGMHWKTFGRLRCQAMSSEQSYLQKIEKYLESFSSGLS